MIDELTMEGLFNYFDPIAIKKIIELSLVKRHLSVHDYCKCKGAFARPQINRDLLPQETGGYLHALLSFNALKRASIDELIEYFSVAEIKKAYLHCYGEYFSIFESKMMASVEKSQYGFDAPDFFSFPLLDEAREKTLALQIQAVMALPLQAFANMITEQDLLLQEIASVLTYQAGKAQKFIAAIQEDDIRYKQVVVSLAFSVLKLGFGVMNVGELVNVGESLSSLASSTFEKIEEKFSIFVSDIHNLVIKAYFRVLGDAEKELLSSTAPEDITLCWVLYRANIFRNANKSIKHILDTCVDNNDFFRCIIKETLYQHEELTDDELLINATEKARLYIQNIVEGLQSQVNKVRLIRDAVLSREGSEKIALYYRKICLINYTMSHENSRVMQQTWLTKALGHRLSYYFPTVIFQEKWTLVKLNDFVYGGVSYCKQKIPLTEYQDRRRNSPVVLGLFRNSSRVKKKLFMSLEEQIPHLSDCLIQELQQPQMVAHSEVNFADDTHDTMRTHYSTRRRQLSLFSFSEPPVNEQTIKPIPQPAPPVVLISQRSFDDLKSH